MLDTTSILPKVVPVCSELERYHFTVLVYSYMILIEGPAMIWGSEKGCWVSNEKRVVFLLLTEIVS